MRINLTGGAYKGRSSDASPEECINLFSEPGPGDAFDALVNVPGGVQFALPAVGEVRGIHRLGEFVYAVIGPNLWKVDSAGVSTDLGPLGTSSGVVSMCDNGVTVGKQVIIADGGSLKV